MEILFNFGFEPILFLAQIVNFLVIYWLLKKFLYKPVLKLLKERNDKIIEGLKNAENAARLIEETVQKEEKILKDAQVKAKKLMDEAKAQSDAILKQAEMDNKKLAEKMLQEAKEQISYETGIAQKKLETNISKLAIDFLQKSVAGMFGEKEEEIIMKKALREIKKTDVE
jgi:F-type H+-transporting ATPase subunit b